MKYHSLGVAILFCKFWFENDTLINLNTANLDTTEYTKEIKAAAEGKTFPPCKFEKSHDIRTSVGGVGGVLA